ncbi:MAG: hypothetical protein E3J69_08960 [Anaerolineales bacterium]|jgi:hypothetical protein|nr:MAG: hypothetical protein E3J69_08960 [Anaerolineales bacterium]
MEINGWLIVIAILAFVILINVGLALGAIRRMKMKPKGIFQESLGEMLNPWKKEDEALDELRQRVDELKSRDGGTQ